ncbi:MAG: PQQ-binding-like beta-propeller repeat protein [Akkermansiaceae bacterium]|jgi:outer membrane protein assembly factor BamB
MKLPALLLASTLSLFAAPPEWSVWRGPDGNGIYDHETTWSHDWPESGPGVLWTAKVHLGYSGSAVSEGKAYTLGNLEGDDLVQCLDATTGETIWSKNYPQDLIPKYNPGGPNSPPVVEGKWLYTFSKQGLASSWDKATGELRWTTDLADLAKAPMPTWGFSSAPVIVGDRLFLNANESGIALDKNTGRLLWNSAPTSCGYAAAVPLTCHDQPALAIFGNKAMHVVSQSDGKILRKIDWPTRYGENSADPQMIDGKLYLSSWWGEGAALFDLEKDSTEPVWTNKEFQNHINPPVLFEGALYGFDGPVHKKKEKSFLRCLDAKTGKTLWSHPDLRGSLILSNGKLIILTDDGSVIIAKATREGFQQLARHDGYGKRTWAPPVLHDGKLHLRDADGTATCLDLR